MKDTPCMQWLRCRPSRGCGGCDNRTACIMVLVVVPIHNTSKLPPPGYYKMDINPFPGGCVVGGIGILGEDCRGKCTVLCCGRSGVTISVCLGRACPPPASALPESCCAAGGRCGGEGIGREGALGGNCGKMIKARAGCMGVPRTKAAFLGPPPPPPASRIRAVAHFEDFLVARWKTRLHASFQIRPRRGSFSKMLAEI
eukprot:gene19756-biopygen10061